MLPMLVARCCRVLVVLHTIHIVGIFKRHASPPGRATDRIVPGDAGRRPRRGGRAPETALHAPRGPTAGVQGIPNDNFRTRPPHQSGQERPTSYVRRPTPPSSLWSLVEGAEAVADCVCLLVEYGSIGAWRPRLWDPSWTLQ